MQRPYSFVTTQHCVPPLKHSPTKLCNHLYYDITFMPKIRPRCDNSWDLYNSKENHQDGDNNTINYQDNYEGEHGDHFDWDNIDFFGEW